MGVIKNFLNDLGDLLENGIDRAGKAANENEQFQKFKEDFEEFVGDAGESMEKGKGVIKNVAENAVSILRDLADKIEEQLNEEETDPKTTEDQEATVVEETTKKIEDKLEE